MSTPSAKMLVYVHDGLARIKIAGRANVASSIDFKRLVNELISRGFACFVIDLSECLLMDSTFLGVLAGFGLQLARPQNGSPTAPSLELFNPNSRIAELLENLGVAHLFKIRRGAADPARNGSAPAEASVTDHTREEVTRNCLEAHRVLMNLDPANALKFKDVAQFLAEDLEKIKAGK
jgi:anti-sigma B factor antagonist